MWGGYLFEQGEVDPSWSNVWMAKCKRKRELGSWEEVEPGLRAGWRWDHGLACRLPGQSPPEMGVEGAGGGEGGGEREEEEEQGLPGQQQEQHGTPGGVIDRLVGHMTVPRLPVLVEAGSNTTNPTTNNSDIAKTIKSMLIRHLHSSQVGKSQGCWLCWVILKALAGEMQGLRWQGGQGAGWRLREAEAGCGGRCCCCFFSRPPPTHSSQRVSLREQAAPA